MGHSSFVVASGVPLLYNSWNKLEIPINHKMFVFCWVNTICALLIVKQMF